MSARIKKCRAEVEVDRLLDANERDDAALERACQAWHDDFIARMENGLSGREERKRR